MSDHAPIIVEQHFTQSAARLWQAITQVDEMRQWFFNNIPDFKPEIGFYTEFEVDAGDRQFLHQWKIVEAIPEQTIVYDWSYRKYPGQGLVRFDLIPQAEGTLLRITNEGLESFPQDIPEFKRESCEGGWKYFIQGNLKDYMAKVGV